MNIWNEVAPRYHKRWIDPTIGPFSCASKMLELISIKGGEHVLDVACGTGSVILQLIKLVGTQGYVVGVDMSQTALNIAKQTNMVLPNLDFVNGDAETVKFTHLFDAVTCQFGIFFFPDAPAALSNLKSVIKEGGRLGIVVHGKNTPYYTCFIEEIVRYIPDFYRSDMPPLDRYAQREPLHKLVRDAGFTDIIIKDVTYTFSPGDFTSYWKNYTQYLAKPYQQKIESLTETERDNLRESIRRRTAQYTKGNIIEFPWQVLILGATV